MYKSYAKNEAKSDYCKVERVIGKWGAIEILKNNNLIVEQKIF